MLTDKKVKAFAMATDATRAKQFYSATLGFKLLSEDDYGLEFEMKDAILRVALGNEEPQNHTILGWCVADINDTLASLKSKGVVFERYGFLNQDAEGVWTSPSGVKVAWFKDPFGNVLSIDQRD